ncbi:MAG: Glu/Leu/Phe/Val dehydrogenase, partial [Candidatus Aenigmatarchaeota archaeon]
IAVSNSRGGILCKEGLDPNKVLAHKKETGTVVGFRGCEKITNEQLLELECDILVPAAIENQITGKNADRIRAKLIAEAANGPVTPEADEMLHKRNIFMIPDFLCNAGGVTVSYFEWVQNRYGYYWKAEEVYRKLDEIMTRAFHEVLKVSKEEGVCMRKAAYMVAVKRIADAMKLRGWV